MIKETVKIQNTDKGVNPPVDSLSDHQLYGLTLIPIEDKMPNWIKDYLGMAEKEFSIRKCKLVPIPK